MEKELLTYMKHSILKLISVAVLAPIFGAVYFSPPSVAPTGGDVTQNTWIISSGNLKPAIASWGLVFPGLATSTTGCLQVGAGGWVSSTGGACGGTGSNVNDWIQNTNFNTLALTPSTTIPVWFKSAVYASTTLTVSGTGTSTFTNIGITGAVYDSIGSPGAAGYVLTSNGSISSWQPPSAAAERSYYFYGQMATSSPSYYKMLTMSTSTEVFLVYSGLSTSRILQSWITATTVPNITSIPAGSYKCHVHAMVSGGNGTLYCEVWEVSSTGADIVRIGVTGDSALLGATNAEYELTFSTSTPWNLQATTSRLVAKVFYTRVSGTGTVTLAVGDGSDAHFHTPSDLADTSNFVPYSGASNNLNLGSFAFTTTGTSTSGGVAATTLNVGTDYIRDLTGSGLVNTGNALTCATAGVATFGCLATTDWAIFNNKISSTSLDISSELAALLTDEVGTGLAVFNTDAWFQTSVKIPTSTNPTIDAAGEVAVNTTAASTSIRFHDGTAERTLAPDDDKTFIIASSTFPAYKGLGATSTISWGMALHAETWLEIGCYASTTGTGGLQFGDASSNWMQYVPITATPSIIPLSTNNSFTRGERRTLRIRAETTLTQDISCTANVRRDAD